MTADAVTENTARVLVIDDEPNMRQMLMSLLGRRGYRVSSAGDGETGIAFCLKNEVEVVLCDVQMPGIDGLEVLRRLQEQNKSITVIMMSAYATVDIAIEAMRCGAYNFITKPFKPDDVLRSLEKAVEIDGLKRENRQLREEVEELRGTGSSFGGIVGDSPVLTELIERAKKVADFSSTVLITGESGTGKELFAKGLHRHSVRKEKPFLATNCAAIPRELLETELFGHIKGAFTGADRSHSGLFTSAEGGTVFLDELGELPMDLQVKLLRVLQEREVRPVGASASVAIDVRVVAATSRNLRQAVREGRFRQDLLYRLNVIELHLPPLRERREDIPLLVDHFIRRFNHRFARVKEEVCSIEAKAMDILLHYNWPGNVRELENALEHAFVYCEGKVLAAKNFPAHLSGERAAGLAASHFEGIYSLKEGKKLLEEQFIAKALKATGGNKSKAAELLEMSYPSLLAKLKKLYPSE